MPITQKKWLFFVSFATVRLRRTHLVHTLNTSKISNDETNTAYAARKNECQLLSCDALLLTNNGNSMPQHFRTTSFGRMAEQGTTSSCMFPVSEAITLFTQLPTVLLLTTALP
jgi:hypothetical protein